MQISTPAIRFTQGERVMYISAAPAGDVVNLTKTPEDWNPLAPQAHGNRPVDKKHVEGIATYLEKESNPVIGAFVLYCGADSVDFVPSSDAALDGIQPGVLSMKPSAMYDIGDGRHRRDAEAAVIRSHAEDEESEVFARVMSMGQPFILIPEDDGRRRAQDYADLQVNVKPPTGSLGMSMDRRQPFNQFMVEDVVVHPSVDLFEGGQRIEFLKDSPGKNSSKWTSFKTVRYMTGTLLTGVSERSTVRWNRAVDESVMGTEKAASLAGAVEFFGGIGRLPDLAQVMSGKTTMADLRAATLLTSANVMYALAYACYLGLTHSGKSYAESLADLAKSVDFSRPARRPTEDDPLKTSEPGGYFAGTLIDADTGRVSSGRPAWEGAGKRLFHSVVGDSEFEKVFPSAVEDDTQDAA